MNCSEGVRDSVSGLESNLLYRMTREQWMGKVLCMITALMFTSIDGQGSRGLAGF